MTTIAITSTQSEIASLIGWWRDAGHDCLVEEAPVDWMALAKLAPAGPGSTAEARRPDAPPAPDAPLMIPETLEGLTALLATDPSLDAAGPASVRLQASGPAGAALMVLVDMPGAGDTGALLEAGDAGAMFDRMLGAMGLSREQCYIAALSPARIAGGRMEDALFARLAPLAARHVELARPRGLWLIGRSASRALLAMDELQARGRIHKINHPGGSVAAIASPGLNMLLTNPKLKAGVWADMQLLMKEIEA